MERNCPNCGNPIPEEAAFCLKCFYSISDPAKQKEEKKKKKPVLFPWLKQHGKKLGTGVAAMLAFLLIMGICILAMKSINSKDSLIPETDTTIIKETSTVAVTNTDGEAVTDEAGEQVFDVVEVTKIQSIPVSTTKRQSLLDKIFNSESKKDESNPDSNNNKNTTSRETFETTEKKYFFDQLIDSVFGDDGKDEPSTNKKTTEEHGTTENTTAPSSTTTQTPSTTAKPTQTTVSTNVGTTAVTTTDSGSYYFEYDAQYPSKPDGNIKLTKYVGNAKVVTIPSYVDGRKVAAIYTDCFINDSKIEEIHFDDSTTYTISTYSHCFNNLSSLTKIVTNNKGVHMDGYFAYKCPITYIGKDGTTGNRLVDGAFYKGSTFYWFTAHPSYTTLTLPDWCTKIDNGNNLNEVNNLKVINIHKNVTNVPNMTINYSAGLKEINVDDGNPMCFSVDGVLFSKFKSSETTFRYCVYPNSKTDKVFKVPSGKKCTFSFGAGGEYSEKVTNRSLEELWLPADAVLSSATSKQFFDNYPNLKRIYITKDHPQYTDILNGNFDGELIIADF